ncbi:saccharopine dehydrogenase NADP-binding domain-containing protein [Xenorhabdus sp. PB62.4]|uniref:saccharopine dehydrogenase NADP-binding domain-containing protein n=1 Tax=Xenorhabdus sp. PB62.4 TaxID=1851573 RepID=UPI00165736FA|nr:Homospermidine synthase [Xenorhabdus sp. PB62.4]
MENVIQFDGKILVLGFGTVAQCLIDVINNHVILPPENIIVIEPGEATEQDVEKIVNKGYQYVSCNKLTKKNYKKTLEHYFFSGDLLVNLTCSVDAIDIMEFAHSKGLLYVDSSFEIWAEDQVEEMGDMQHQTLYALHNRAREVSKRWEKNSPTAITNHGANPGIVNHLTKAALVELAKHLGIFKQAPETREQWAELARKCSVKVIHISERDTQISHSPKPIDEFRNTWSVQAFMDEATSLAELGWGTHEKTLPSHAITHNTGSKNALFFHRYGCDIVVKSWLPDGGQIYGYLMPHSECVTLSQYFTVFEDSAVVYRPTVKFAYLPAPDAFVSIHEYMMSNWTPHAKAKIIKDDIITGSDELGILLMGHNRKTFWYGSQVDIHRARQIVPGHNATTMQVIGGVISAIIWCLTNPKQGYCETEDLPYQDILSIAEPYISPIYQSFSDWSPTNNEENMTEDDRWQFKNYLVRT